MQPRDRKRFGACLMAVAEVYGKPPSEAIVGLWWNALAAFDIEAVEGAISSHLADPDRGQFMPRPADIARQITGTSKDASLVAWSAVDKAVRQIGIYASVTFDDPITMRVLQDMGGWIALCAKSENDWPFVGNEFMTRHQGFRSRGEVPDHPARLIGVAEAENSRNGFAHREFALIGDQDKARRILETGADRPALVFGRVADVLPRLDVK